MIRGAAISLMALGAAACGSTENMCKSAVTSTLINPETAKFYDFSELSDAAYVSKFVAAARQSNDPSLQMITEGVTEGLVAKSHVEHPGLKYYEMRVRAEGRLGNQITSDMFCIATDDQCRCSNPSAA